MDKKYEILYKLSQDIYNISSVLLKYCKKSNDEEIVKIYTIVNMLNKKADDLHFECMELKNLTLI